MYRDTMDGFALAARTDCDIITHPGANVSRKRMQRIVNLHTNVSVMQGQGQGLQRLKWNGSTVFIH